MSNKNDLTGQKFGWLVVIEEVEPVLYINKKTSYTQRQRVYKCMCVCGKTKEIRRCNLVSGRIKSCGCYKDEHLRARIEYAHVDGTSLDRINGNELDRNNTSGVTGVYWTKNTDRWMAQIVIKGNRKHLGYFKNKQDAINARKAAEEKYFKPILDKYAQK